MKLAALSKKCIHGTDVLRYAKSPFFLWCFCHAPETEQDPPSEYMEMIMQRGKDHEEAYLQKAYPGLKRIEVETTEDVLRELKRGREAFDNLWIFDLKRNLVGVPDILERDDSHASAFGPFHYVVKEVKSGKMPKKHQVLQATFYNYVLGLLQGYTPPVFYMVNKAGEEIPYEFAKYKEELLIALKEIAQVKKGKTISPTLGMDYPWKAYSEARARKAQDISLITQIAGKRKAILNKAGYKTIKDLAKASVQDLAGLEGIGETVATQIKNHVTAWLQQKPLLIGTVHLPLAKTEIYFDLEATMPDEVLGVTAQVNYLFGLLIVKEGKDRFIPLVAERLEKEGELCRAFLALLEAHPEAVIYHFSRFEKVQLKRMFSQFKVPQKTRNRILASLVDVQQLVKQSVVFPTLKNGLKEIAGYLGFVWRHQDVNAMESMAWYFDYLKGDKEKLQKIIDYNEDDCRATKVVKDWLEKNVRA